VVREDGIILDAVGCMVVGFMVGGIEAGDMTGIGSQRVKDGGGSKINAA